MQLTIKVKGELVRRGLQDLAAEIPKVGRQQIRTAMERVKRIVQTYPPEPPNRVRYGTHAVLGRIITRAGRTGDYGKGWKIDPATNGYTISNDVAYAVYVSGDAYGGRQRTWKDGSMQAYGWHLTRDVVEKEVAKLPDEIEKEISIVARRHGL